MKEKESFKIRLIKKALIGMTHDLEIAQKLNDIDSIEFYSGVKIALKKMLDEHRDNYDFSSVPF